MPDDIDELLGGDILAPPAGFTQRITALARTMPQIRAPSRGLRPWQWVSLAAGAGCGTLLLAEFVLFAFVVTGAR